MENFEGYLFAKLFAIGSKSEGPEYFLQQWTDSQKNSDTQIKKKSNLWEEDPELHSLLGRKVSIEGKLNLEKIEYTKIEVVSTLPNSEQDKLKFALKIEGQGYNEAEGLLSIILKPSNTFSAPSPLRKLNIILTVEWPFRSIWHGECPTSQLYDFYITDLEEKTIWQWSKSMIFTQNKTSVNIPGGSPIEFPVSWYYQGEALEKMKTLNFKAIFSSTGNVINKAIKIKFNYLI
jgi:hypothetical protein